MSIFNSSICFFFNSYPDSRHILTPCLLTAYLFSKCCFISDNLLNTRTSFELQMTNSTYQNCVNAELTTTHKVMYPLLRRKGDMSDCYSDYPNTWATNHFLPTQTSLWTLSIEVGTLTKDWWEVDRCMPLDDDVGLVRDLDFWLAGEPLPLEENGRADRGLWADREGLTAEEAVCDGRAWSTESSSPSEDPRGREVAKSSSGLSLARHGIDESGCMNK